MQEIYKCFTILKYIKNHSPIASRKSAAVAYN